MNVPNVNIGSFIHYLNSKYSKMLNNDSISMQLILT